MSNGPEFFETKMGRQYYDGTLPKIAKALERIADALEKQNAIDFKFLQLERAAADDPSPEKE